jgi:hypothetical protein
MYWQRSKYYRRILDFRAILTHILQISDFSKMMQDVEACLKPGGIVFFIDGDQRFYEENAVGPIPIGVDPEDGGDPKKGSWLFRIGRGE